MKDILSKMIILAAKAHEGQFDKGGNPYILHPLAVMYKLKTNDEELMCIAVLHDVIEDTDITYHDLREAGANERIIEALKCLTKVPGQTYEEYKSAVFSNKDAMLVKQCDLRHNSDLRRLKGIRDKDLDRVVKYTKFYYEIEQRLTTVSLKSYQDIAL